MGCGKKCENYEETNKSSSGSCGKMNRTFDAAVLTGCVRGYILWIYIIPCECTVSENASRLYGINLYRRDTVRAS